MNEKTQTFTWVKNWEQRERESGLEIEILSHFWWSEGLKEKKRERMCVGLRRDQHQTSLHHHHHSPGGSLKNLLNLAELETSRKSYLE